MEKVWLPLSECVQFRTGLMHDALLKYPWEDDEYAFDFDSYYPPIPDELACIRKLLERKTNYRNIFPEDIRDCPFCPLDMSPLWLDVHATTDPADVDLLNHPVWDMDPIPCPSHLYYHVWPYGGAPALITPTILEDTKKYLNQVRNSRGYDVDCFPPPLLVYQTFRKCDLNYKSKDELESTVIKHIELKTGKKYKLEEILKMVSTDRQMTLVTFTAKVDSATAASETFVATLNDGTNPIMECLLKPDCDAPGPDHYPDFEIQPIGIPSSVRMYLRKCNQPQTQDSKLWAPQRTSNPLFAVPDKDTFSAAASASSNPLFAVPDAAVPAFFNPFAFPGKHTFSADAPASSEPASFNPCPFFVYKQLCTAAREDSQRVSKRICTAAGPCPAGSDMTSQEVPPREDSQLVSN